jgi:hypothetical protein
MLVMAAGALMLVTLSCMVRACVALAVRGVALAVAGLSCDRLTLAATTPWWGKSAGRRSKP